LSNAGKTNDYLAYDNYLKGNYILNTLAENNNDTWKLYHQGKFYWGKTTPESNKLAITLFSQAIKTDRNFALAYIGLAHCYANYVNLVWDFDIKWLNKAEDLIKEAQTISPDLPEYYSTLIEIYIIKEIAFNENKKELAFGLAREGIKKYPDNAKLNSILGYCYFMRFGEEGDEADFKNAFEYKEKSFWLNPYGLNNLVYAELLMLNKEFYEALHICSIVEKHDSSLMTKFRLGEIYYYLGDLDSSMAIFQQFEIASLNLKIASMFYLGMIHSQRGEGEKALKIINDIRLISPQEFVISDYLYLASVYMGLDMKKSAYNSLESFFNKLMNKKMRFVWLKYIDIDRNFNGVREEDEFLKIIKNKGEIHG